MTKRSFKHLDSYGDKVTLAVRLTLGHSNTIWELHLVLDQQKVSKSQLTAIKTNYVPKDF